MDGSGRGRARKRRESARQAQERSLFSGVKYGHTNIRGGMNPAAKASGASLTDHTPRSPAVPSRGWQDDALPSALKRPDSVAGTATGCRQDDPSSLRRPDSVAGTASMPGQQRSSMTSYVTEGQQPSGNSGVACSSSSAPVRMAWQLGDVASPESPEGSPRRVSSGVGGRVGAQGSQTSQRVSQSGTLPSWEPDSPTRSIASSSTTAAGVESRVSVSSPWTPESLESQAKSSSPLKGVLKHSEGVVDAAARLASSSDPSENANVQAQRSPVRPATQPARGHRDWDLCMDRAAAVRGREEASAPRGPAHSNVGPNGSPIRNPVTPESSPGARCGTLSRKQPRTVSPESTRFEPADDVPVRKPPRHVSPEPGPRGFGPGPIEAPLGRRKQNVEVGDNFEFRPSSRSSSENSQPNTPVASARTPRRPLMKMHGDGKEDYAACRDSLVSQTSSIETGRSGSSTAYLNFDSFDLQIENARAPNRLVTWEDLPCIVSDNDDSVRQCIEWYGWKTPTQFQAVAIPCICQACQSTKAKSYTLLQAARSLGKTSAMVLSLLASVKTDAPLQFVVVALGGCKDIERYLNVLGCLCPVKVAFLDEELEGEEDVEADVDRLRGAQIAVGRPNRLSAALEAGHTEIDMAQVQALLIDDVAELISLHYTEKICHVNQLLSVVARSALRYVVVSDFVPKEAKAALRTLKSSLMSKKNMFDLSVQVGRLKKCVNHYAVPGSACEDWLDILVELQEKIFIPRAVIFCDDEELLRVIRDRLNELNSEAYRKYARTPLLNIAVLDPEQTLKQRRDALSLFTTGKKDFLLTRSEPNIFQSGLPRVFFVVHFGVATDKLSWYGCRLLCFDESLRAKSKGPHQDAVSILLTPPGEDATMSKLQKMFGIRFEPLPFETLHATKSRDPMYVLPAKKHLPHWRSSVFEAEEKHGKKPLVEPSSPPESRRTSPRKHTRPLRAC